jgi:hypothetical protein
VSEDENLKAGEGTPWTLTPAGFEHATDLAQNAVDRLDVLEHINRSLRLQRGPPDPGVDDAGLDQIFVSSVCALLSSQCAFSGGASRTKPTDFYCA